MKSLSLCKDWSVCEAGGSKVYQADIPAMVTDILYKNREIEDPYDGENEWKTYEVLKKNYNFSNHFEVTEEMLEADELLLRFEGIDTIADIYINGTHLAFVNDMHRTYSYDIRSLVEVGRNEILICFQSAILYAEEQHRKEPYYKTPDTVDGFSLVRKAHCQYGWDWGPKLPDMGLFRDVTILAYEKAKFTDVYVRQFHENNQVRVQFDVEIQKFVQDADTELEILIKAPDETEICGTYQAIKEKDSYVLEIENPQLWWCHGFGEQPLYEVKLQISAAGEVLEQKKMRIGLRTLTVRREKDQWGESFEFFLNGTSVFAMGANYIPEDSLYPRTSYERSKHLIEQCVKANYNSIRVWGGGYFYEDYFYDLCDEYGLIVWQDLLFACGVYRLHEEFVENVVQETIDNVKRLRHHASIALWCGNNELEWGWSGWDMGFGDKVQDKADYIKLFEWILPRTVKKIDPDRFYWLASPSSGGSFDDPNDQNRGDVHYWDVWHRLKHFTEYRKYYFRFCSEFGFQSFPCEKTVNTFAREEDKNIFSPVMENHQKNGGANGLILYYLSANFKYPAKFATLLYVSQILQAEAIRYGVEHWRSNRGRCMGALYWQVNDCWPVASWSSLDYYNRWKPLHYYARKFYAPVLLSALEEKGQVKFVVSNETRKQVEAKVVWRLRDCQGAILEEKEITSQVDALSAKNCGEADYHEVEADRFQSRRHYLEYVLFVDGEKTSEGTLLFTRPKHFEFQDPEVSYQTTEEEDRFVLTFETKNYAKYVWIDSPDFDFVASDNCFDFSKGENYRIEILKSEITKEGKPYAATLEEMKHLPVLTAFDIR